MHCHWSLISRRLKPNQRGLHFCKLSRILYYIYFKVWKIHKTHKIKDVWLQLHSMFINVSINYSTEKWNIFMWRISSAVSETKSTGLMEFITAMKWTARSWIEPINSAKMNWEMGMKKRSKLFKTGLRFCRPIQWYYGCVNWYEYS